MPSLYVFVFLIDMALSLEEIIREFRDRERDKHITTAVWYIVVVMWHCKSGEMGTR